MNYYDASRLTPNTRVQFDDGGTTGTVWYLQDGFCYFSWDDGQTSALPFDDMEAVSLLPVEVPVFAELLSQPDYKPAASVRKRAGVRR